MDCPLCASRSLPYHNERYEQCTYCHGIFLLPQYLLDREKELQRYRKHENDVNDPRYQDFVRPIVDKVAANFHKEHWGLDFGCGNGPVISHLLEGQGYRVRKWDPFFFPDETVFERKYDFIILSEVMEHFHDPGLEFKRLFSMLEPGGMILCLTEIYHRGIDFGSWRYKDDETHVFFYTMKTLEYIAGSIGGAKLKVDGRSIVFQIPISA